LLIRDTRAKIAWIGHRRIEGAFASSKFSDPKFFSQILNREMANEDFGSGLQSVWI